MSEASPFPSDFFDAAGLNRQFVFDLATLPGDIRATLGDTRGFRSLILLGHAGRALWECVQASGLGGEHPIDDYTVRTVERCCTERLAGAAYRILYPGAQPIGLQALGRLAGWHQPSPLMIGVDPEWGSWWAYRAVVLSEFEFSPFFPVDRRSPCLTCQPAPCIATCPAQALSPTGLDLARCAEQRLQPESPCALGCPARQACPVGQAHRYRPEQTAHSYRQSLAMLRQIRDGARPGDCSKQPLRPATS